MTDSVSFNVTNYFHQHETAARAIVERVGKTIVIGAAIAVGKPTGLLNALYRLACEDSTIQLTIITGLTLAKPTLQKKQTKIERNFLNPILDRLLKACEEPLYEIARVNQQLPHNIRIIEFFLSPGKFLNNAYVQQNYVSSNYSNIVRDCINFSINVLAQQVSPSPNKQNKYSLSANSDLFHGIKEYLLKSEQQGNKIAIIGEVNGNLPYMPGETAEIEGAVFTDMIDTQKYPALFPMIREALSVQDHLIGLYTSCLIKDDGCLQIGIGNLGLALSNALIFRHKNNVHYHALLKQLNAYDKFGKIILSVGGDTIFKTGLYASTEMLSDEYLQLFNANILKKKVYDTIAQQQSLTGKVIHAGFFFGSNDFYHQLRNLSDEQLNQIDMVSIARTNSLLWSPELLTLQRKNARFVNTGLMVTLLGGVIADGLQDYHELSGVGGQYDFVSMANQLPDAYSITLCRSTRNTKEGVKSNIVWEYPNVTIPRYLRDIIITEYGIADCRSKTDADVIKAILNITDSRFQNTLLHKAKKAGKIALDYEIPKIFKHNYPDKIEKIIKHMQSIGHFLPYPFGSDLTIDEEVLARALLYLKNCSKLKLAGLMVRSFFIFKGDSDFKRYFIRINLQNKLSMTDYLYKKLLKCVIAENI